jgi:hypothetical protein
MAVKKKKIKTGGLTLEEAKKKINDPNYNVMSGRIEKDKNVQTGPNKRRITKEDMMNIGMGVLPFSRIPKFLSQLPRILKPSQRFQRLVQGTRQSKIKGQGSGQFLPKRVNPSAKRITTTTPTGSGRGKPPPLVKPRSTQVKKPGTSVISRPLQRINTNRAKPSPQQLTNRATVVTGLSELVKPKKSIAKDKTPTIKVNKPKKTPKVKKDKLKKLPPKKDYVGQFVNEKGDVAYESVSDFLGYLTGKQRKRAAPKDKKRITPAKKGATKGIAFKGKSVAKLKNPFKKAGGGSMKKPIPPEAKGLQALKRERPDVVKKMGYMKKGGKVIKMRGGGAATKGLRFNRGY